MDCCDDGLPLELKDNEDRILGFAWTRSGAPVIASEVVFAISCRSSALQGGDILFTHTWTVGDGITVDPVTGIIDVAITAEQITATGLPLSGRWSCLARDAATLLRREIGWGPCTIVDGLAEMEVL